MGLLFGLVWPAGAELQFDVFPGYGLGASDGAVAEASWFPVTCEIFNDGPAFNGVVELADQSGESHVVRLELPTGTRKRILVPFYCSGRWLALDAYLRDDRGKLRASQLQLHPRQFTDRFSPLIGSLSRTLAGSAVLPTPPKSNSQLLPGVTRLSVELFPDNPLALEGLSVLYLHSARAVELKAGQVSALLAWLHGGGHLIVAVEQPADINATAWLKQILPCEITGLTTRPDQGVLQAWLNSDARQPGPGQAPNVISPSRPRRPGPNSSPAPVPSRPITPQGEKSSDPNPFVRLAADPEFESAQMPVALATLRDGRVLLGSEEAPLALQSVRGRGTLTVLLFSPELEPFRSWKQKDWFWAKLADVPIEWLGGWNISRNNGGSIDGVFGALIDSKQIRKLPVGWLFVLLLGYLAVIGPIDQYVLKKIKRQMLTWLTFPAYVAFFSVLIYYIGYRLRAGETEWNEFHVVDVIPHGERADLRGHTYGSVYSPVNAQYPVASEAPCATLRGEREHYGGQALSKAVVEQRGNSFQARLTAPVWTSQLFLSDWWRQSTAPLNLTITKTPGFNQLVIKIENLTGKTIPQARLVLDGRVHDLGELPPSKTFTVNAAGGTDLRQFVDNQTGNFQSAIEARRSQFGGNRPDSLADSFTAATAASFVSFADVRDHQNQSQPYGAGGLVSSRAFDLGSSVRRGDAILLAWLPGETLIKPINQFTPRRSHHDTMLRVVVPVK